MKRPIAAAVIPVAGLGTRLLPATKSQPKEMLPVVDVPVVQYVVEELARAGIDRVLFVTGRRKRAIEDHFDLDAELELALDGRGRGSDPSAGLEIQYVRQPRPRGLGDALRYAEGFAAGGPIVVALGDAIITPARPGIVARLRAAYVRHGADVAVAVEEVDAGLVDRYGIVTPGAQLDGEHVLEVADLVEKPSIEAAPSRLAVAARYVIGPATFDALRDLPPDPTGEVELADAIRLVIRRGGRVIAVPLGPGERRHDIGTVEGYCTTFVEFALTDPRFGAALRLRASALVDALR